MRILVVNVSAASKNVCIPLIYFKLKQLAEDSLLDIDWVEPIYHGGKAEYLLKGKNLKNIDVVFLSCYVWNIIPNITIAEEIKKINPKCTVIAGGPHIPVDSENPFELYPVLDYTCTTELENVFPKIFVEGFTIPGMRSRTFDERFKGYTNLKEQSSPWVRYQKEIASMVQDCRNKKISTIAVWESNRGCPFKCTFCDWGSSTNAKIRRYDYETVAREIDVLSECQLDTVHIADANYGVFAQDVDYIQRFVDNRLKNGYPKWVNFSANKNNKQYVNECFKLLHSAGMSFTSPIGFQHTDEEVLEIMERGNIRAEKLEEEIAASRSIGAPVIGSLIVGSPGDTVEKWHDTYYTVLEMGFHDGLIVHDFMMLPNAPANSKNYKDEWQIQVNDAMFNDYPRIKKHTMTFPANFVVSTKSFTKEDYADMQLFSAFMQACHIVGATKFIALYLRYAKNISFKDFYETLWNSPIIQDILTPVKQKLIDYAYGKRKLKHINGVLPEYIVYEIIVENYDKVLSVASANLNNTTIEHDVLQVQKNIIITWLEPTDFTIKSNILEFYKNCLLGITTEFEFKTCPERKIKNNNNLRVGYGCKNKIPHFNYNKISWRCNAIGKRNNRYATGYRAEIIHG